MAQISSESPAAPSISSRVDSEVFHLGRDRRREVPGTTSRAAPRVAIYARVSTSEQNADMQTAELREYAARRGWTLAGEFVDTGISGTKASRPELDKLMAAARRRRFDLVLVWRFDRFARSTAHLLAALDEFRGLGVDFVSLHEAVDTTTPLGKMVFTVVAAVAELERTIIVERVKAGVERARAKGKKLGRPQGTKADVAQIGALTAEGQSVRQIARALGVGIGTVQRAKAAFQKSQAKSDAALPAQTRAV
ncbi:MAG TPA: recombinase family protein [Planctomycetota bacterium]|nr:recombinase family protein [Planctomycetota bacterium]